MARILLVDPDNEVTQLFAHLVRRVGHVPVPWTDGMEPADVDADAALVEPALEASMAFARRLHTERPDLRIVVASIRSRSGSDTELGAVAHLVKPLERRDLARALETALAAA